MTKHQADIFTFEQAWNINAAALGTLLGGITAAQAARGEIPEGMNYAKVVRAELLSPRNRGYKHVQGRALYLRGILQGSAPLYELAAEYIRRNEKRRKVERA